MNRSSGQFRRPLLAPEDLTLMDAIDNRPERMAAVSEKFRESDSPFRPSFWTLIVDAGAGGSQVSETALQAAATSSPVALIREDVLGDFAVVVWPSQVAGIVHLMSLVPMSDYRWHRLEREIRRVTSGLTPFSLELEDFRVVAQRLEVGGRVRVSRTTGRSVLDGSSISRGWARERPPFEEAFVELMSHPASIRTLTLWVGHRTHLQIRRSGGSTLYGGDSRLFEEGVLSSLASSAAMRRALLQDRSRPPGNPLEVALEMHFSSPAFSDSSGFQELKDLLYGDPDLGVAVLHANPYFHATISDYEDASTVDLFVTSPNTATIFPGYKATMAALSRIADRMADRFPFSHLTAVPAHPSATAEDFLGGE